jgi:hypothetical protein
MASSSANFCRKTGTVRANGDRSNNFSLVTGSRTLQSLFKIDCGGGLRSVKSEFTATIVRHKIVRHKVHSKK